jgi:serine/threonine protein kinase/dipeptidyl aminopeptidase/acylaminoacyl peptidase
MNVERYRQIEALAEAALQVEPSRRPEFLQRVCGSDQELLERVNALLRGYETAGDFLNEPALEAWGRDVAKAGADHSLAGRRVGRYVIASRLGAGGIGEVWLAQDTELAREVALKFLSPQLAGHSGQARRFRQEARAASSLNHPNLVTIFDIGEFEGRQFIAQEYIRGKTVRDTLQAGCLPVEAVAAIAAQIAAGLSAAQAAGIVHRDIKPENIMIRPDGVVKIVDFGIARFTDDSVEKDLRASTGSTRPGTILGTARYMSPEQARGLPVDGRSDIFSLGVVLYEMLTGAAPFTGSTPSDVLAAILTNDPAPMSRVSRDVPAEFERIVRHCLAKDRSARYPSAAALQEDLKRLTTPSRAARSQIMPWAIGLSGTLLLAALIATILVTSRKEPTPVFSSVYMTRIATRGDVSDVTISKDGKLLAYILDDGEKHGIWVRDTSGSNERLAATVDDGEVSGVMISPDDAYLYYRLKGNDGIGNLFRFPVKGGAVLRVIGDVSGAAALSPDGKRIAFVRIKPSTWEASLMVSNADGSGGESAVQTVQRPKFIDERGVAWSPDGESIAYFAGESAPVPDRAFQLVEANLRHPAQRLITAQLWRPKGLAWAAKGNFLVVAAATPGDLEQLWMVRHDTAEVTKLTNDLSSYGRGSISDDGKSVVAVRSESSVTIWAAAGNDNARFKPISASTLASPRIAVAWTPDNRVIYNNPADGYRDIWRMGADGSNPQRLTSSPSNKDELVQTPDGRYIVYQQDPHIWRVNNDGTDPKQLTDGRLDVHPAVSPDGKSVVYASFADWAPGIGGEPTLWRVPIDGGAATRISQQPASIPSVSPDGKQIACVHFPRKDPRNSSALLAVMKADGTGGFTILQRTPSAGTTLSWSPDGKAIDFVMSANGVGNIWRQPLNGGPPAPITHFDRDDLIHFSWSREGRLLCTRGFTARSAVLIRSSP